MSWLYRASHGASTWSVATRSWVWRTTERWRTRSPRVAAGRCREVACSCMPACMRSGQFWWGDVGLVTSDSARATTTLSLVHGLGRGRLWRPLFMPPPVADGSVAACCQVAVDAVAAGDGHLPPLRWYGRQLGRHGDDDVARAVPVKLSLKLGDPVAQVVDLLLKFLLCRCCRRRYQILCRP